MKILRRMILNLAEIIIPIKSDSDVYLLMERLENSKVSEETPSSFLQMKLSEEPHVKKNLLNMERMVSSIRILNRIFLMFLREQ